MKGSMKLYICAVVMGGSTFALLGEAMHSLGEDGPNSQKFIGLIIGAGIALVVGALILNRAFAAEDREKELFDDKHSPPGGAVIPSEYTQGNLFRQIS